jgi:hypothetical protein
VLWPWFIRRPLRGSSATGWSSSSNSRRPRPTAIARLRCVGPWHIETPICCLPFRRTAAPCTDPSATSAGVLRDACCLAFELRSGRTIVDIRTRPLNGNLPSGTIVYVFYFSRIKQSDLFRSRINFERVSPFDIW